MEFTQKPPYAGPGMRAVRDQRQQLGVFGYAPYRIWRILKMLSLCYNTFAYMLKSIIRGGNY